MDRTFNSEDLRLVVTFLLEDKNMTQRALAEKLFIEESTLSRYLSGARKPGPEIIIAMAQILNVSTDTLLLGGKEYVDKAKQQKIDREENNELSDSAKENVSMIKTETAVKVTKEELKENRKNTIMIQSVSGLMCLAFVLYMGPSGAFEKFNEFPFYAYPLLATAMLTVIALTNCLNSGLFPKFRKVMLVLGIAFAISFMVIVALFWFSMLK